MGKTQIGIGPTEALSLRVSVATLARVIFPGGEDGERHLALEHKATVFHKDGELGVELKAQPFGGAVRILNPAGLQAWIGSYNFDNEHSRAERDFRIFIHPTDWKAVQTYCLDHLNRESGSDLEVDPSRELTEEFAGTVGVALRTEQYLLRPGKTIVEDAQVRTGNVFAAGIPTVRVYRIFETRIVDPVLCQGMAANSKAHPGQVLKNLALQDADKGGRGWANAMLVIPERQIHTAYQAVPVELRSAPLPFRDTFLDNNVTAILEGIPSPIYRKA